MVHCEWETTADLLKHHLQIDDSSHGLEWPQCLGNNGNSKSFWRMICHDENRDLCQMDKNPEVEVLKFEGFEFACQATVYNNQSIAWVQLLGNPKDAKSFKADVTIKGCSNNMECSVSKTVNVVPVDVAWFETMAKKEDALVWNRENLTEYCQVRDGLYKIKVSFKIMKK